MRNKSYLSQIKNAIGKDDSTNSLLQNKDIRVECPKSIFEGQSLTIKWSVSNNDADISIYVENGVKSHTYNKLNSTGKIRIKSFKETNRNINVIFSVKKDGKEINKHFTVKVAEFPNSSDGEQKEKSSQAVYSCLATLIGSLFSSFIIMCVLFAVISRCSSSNHKQPTKNINTEQQYSLPQQPTRNSSTEQQYSLPQKPTIVNEFDVEAAEYRLYRLDDEMTYHGMKTLHIIVRSDNRITADGMRVSPTSNSSIGRKYDFQCGNSNFAYFFNTNQLTIK